MAPRTLGFWGKAWASPNTVLGIALGAAGIPGGARLVRGENALHFLGHPLLLFLPARAITFGHCVLFRPGIEPDTVVGRYDGRGSQVIGDHEYAHTLQYERWGPFFLPAYLVAWMLRRPHPLECQADRWAAARKGKARS